MRNLLEPDVEGLKWQAEEYGLGPPDTGATVSRGDKQDSVQVPC